MEQSPKLSALLAPETARSWTDLGTSCARVQEYRDAATAFLRAQLIDTAGTGNLRNALVALSRLDDR